MTRTVHRGMTLIEVVACLLLLSVGVISVFGLVMYGNALAQRAQSESTAMATATTILYDAHPPTMTDRVATGATVVGYLNGYFVRRTEASVEPLSASAAGIPVTAVTVTVELYLGMQGTHVLTYRQRLLEHRP